MKRIIKIIAILFCFLIFFITISKANKTIESEHYEVNSEKSIISRIEPETTIGIFKQKISSEEIKESEITIYKDNKEITTGYVGTGMVLKYDDKQYKLSVVGDFDGDGKATQVELTNIIRYIVGLQDSKLDGVFYTSGDLTGDGLVDQRDITKYIKYIVYGELDLGKVDKTPPIITLEQKQVDTDEIKVEAKAMDRESGMEEEPTFTFYIKKANEPDSSYLEKQKGTEPVLNVSGLEQETEYEVKVVTKDKSGNEASKVIKVKTEKVPDTLEFGLPAWNNGQAEIQISTNTKYKIEYKINETTENWEQSSQDETVVTVMNLNHNDVVYARLTDGTNVGNYINTKIIDDKAPEINIDIAGNTSEITATAIAVDNETGIDENSNYIFYIKKETETIYKQIQKDKSKICKITGLEANQIYTIKVEIEDKAGNLGIKEVKGSTQKIPDATEVGIINFGTSIWNNGQAEVTISTNTEYQIEYQVNGTSSNWIKGTTVNGLEHNDIIYARLTDGKNTSNEATLTVIDNKAPIIELSLKSEISEIQAIITATDNESGMEEIPTYIFYIKETTQDDSSYVEKQRGANASYKFTGLEQSKNYTVKVETTDRAGNVSTKEETITTKTMPDGTQTGAINFGIPVWNDGKASVTISTNTTYKLEYQINGTTSNWIQGNEDISTITVTGIKHNDIIYARLTDGINVGQYATITIIDDIQPEEFTISVTDITTTGFKIQGSTIDNQSGIESYTYVVEKEGDLTSASTKAKSNNVNSVSYNNSNIANTGRSNNKCFRWRKWFNI